MNQEEEWHAWRLKGLGSSDAPIIMGLSPWMTAYQLWQEKCGLTTRDSNGNWATQRGNRLEPIARVCYELLTGLESPAGCFVHPIYPWVRSSLDGYNEASGTILEIKCPGKDDHELAKQGKIPPKYMPQIMHQLLTMPKAKRVNYFSFDGTRGVLVTIERDEEYMSKLFFAEMNFWQLVQSKTPPELTAKDYKVSNSKSLRAKLKRYQDLKIQEKKTQVEMKELFNEIVSETKHPNTRLDRWCITTVNRKGAVDYAAIPELAGVDLDTYRKPGSSYFTITGVGD